MRLNRVIPVICAAALLGGAWRWLAADGQVPEPTPVESSDDWPGYRGPNRDAIVPATLPDDWPKELKVVWTAPVGGGFSSPAVVADRAYVIMQDGGDEAVRCLDARDGKQIWEHKYAARFRSSYGDGPRATPQVDGDRVYTVGGTGELYCLKATDGSVVWRRSCKNDFHYRVAVYGCSPSPLIDGDKLIVHVGGRDGHSIVALDKLTGKLLWKSQDDPPGYASPEVIPASPKTGPRQLIVFTELGVVSLNPSDGTLYWRFDWQTSYEQNIAQPMLSDDLLVITSLTGCAALRLSHEADRPTYKVAWRSDEMAVHFSCPTIKDGFLYGVHGRGGELRCMEVKDGTIKWRQRLPARQRADFVLAGRHLLIYTDTGELVVVDASPVECRERARYAIAGRNWIPPVMAGGCLFLRDERKLHCVQLPKAGATSRPD